MPVYLGSNKSRLALGDKLIKEAYSGSTLVYRNYVKWYENGTMFIPFSIGVNYNNRGSVSNTNGYMQVQTTEDTSYMSNNKVDLTNVNTIKFTLSYFNSSATPTYAAFLVGNSRTARVYNGQWKKKITTTTPGEIIVDVSDLSGEYYIGFGVINGTGRVTSIRAY